MIVLYVIMGLAGLIGLYVVYMLAWNVWKLHHEVDELYRHYFPRKGRKP